MENWVAAVAGLRGGGRSRAGRSLSYDLDVKSGARPLCVRIVGIYGFIALVTGVIVGLGGTFFTFLDWAANGGDVSLMLLLLAFSGGVVGIGGIQSLLARSKSADVVRQGAWAGIVGAAVGLVPTGLAPVAVGLYVLGVGGLAASDLDAALMLSIPAVWFAGTLVTAVAVVRSEGRRQEWLADGP